MKIPLLIGLALLAGCGSRPEEEAETKAVVDVKTAVAEEAPVDSSLRAPATIVPRELANITPRITGVIRELTVRKGDTVSAGALLAKLESRDLNAQREEARAALADSQANLDKTRQGTLPTDIERARGQVATTRALLNQAQTVYDRRKALFEQGAIPNRDLLVSETDLSTARTNSEVATRSLQLLEQQSQGQDIRMAEARVEQAKSRLANVTAQQQYTELRAPFTGAITEQFQYAGDLGQPTAPIFTLVDLSVVSARAQVPDAAVSRIAIGQPCHFSSGEAQPDQILGRVTVINRAVDALRRTVEVWCEIAHPPQSLRSGTFGSVDFETAHVAQAVLVPVAALQLEEGTRKGTVLVVDPAQVAHRREVEVGDLEGNRRVVTRGLKAGETVVTEGGYEVPDGTQIRTGKAKGR